MTFRETFYQVKGLMESRLHDFGLESADASTMGWTTMLSIEQNTRVTIDVPLILIYSDEFLISGTLETSTYSRLNGKTVKLKVGNTVVATTTTNINGEYSFTHTPVSTGNHSFQVIFEGTNIHAASQSSVVNRTVDKETSVINLDGISTQHYGDTVIFGGQLLDNDGQYISSASVKYYLNNSLVTTLTTDAQGRFSTSKSVDSFDTQNIKFIYDGDSNYTNCESSSQIDVYQPQLSLTSDKDVLSYADNDSATLTVQVQDNAPVPQNLAISNHLVTLLGYDDSAATASDFTDTNSIASISDSGQTIVMHSNSATSDSNVVHNATFGSKSMLMSFNIDSATISDAAYIAAFNAAGTSLIGYLQLSTGQYEIYTYNDANAIIVIKDGSTLGSIQLNGASSYKVGFYLSETRIVLSDVQVHEIVDSGYTNSSGACTLTYDSQGIGDVFLTAQANINSTLVTETYAIQDIYLYDECTSAKHSWKNGSGSCSYSYSSNGMSITGTATNGASLLLDETLPNHYSAEFTITGMQSNSTVKCSSFGLETVYIDPRSSNSILANVTDWTTINNVINVNDTIKMEWNGTKVSFYQNGTKITEYNKNGSGVNNGLFFRNLTGSGGWTGITIKDLKIRSL